MIPHAFMDSRKEINENSFQHFLSFIMSLLPYPVRSSFKEKNQLESILHGHCRRQKTDLEHKRCSQSLRTANHLILLVEYINQADKLLKLCISKNLNLLKLISLAKGYRLLFTIPRVEYGHFRKSHGILSCFFFFFLFFTQLFLIPNPPKTL